MMSILLQLDVACPVESVVISCVFKYAHRLAQGKSKLVDNLETHFLLNNA